MKTTSLIRPLFAACALALATAVPPLLAQDMPEMPKPQSEHTWLAKFAGTWETEMECTAPGQEPMKMKMTDSIRMLGGFWLVTESKGEAMGQPFTGVMTLGYSPEKKAYIGTWVDSMNSTMWNYNGTVNDAGDTLTLESEGPCPMQGGKICKVKEVMKLTGKDEKTFTSSVLGEDGKWVQMMSAKSKRVK
jgi:hypothetical protein